MRTFAIETLGCKVNQYENQQIRQFLESLGLTTAEPSEKPDLIMVYTCCVTHTASAKSRQCIHRVQSHNPAAFTVVCGCLPVMKNGELTAESGKDIHFVKDRNNLATIIQKIVSSGSIKPASELHKPSNNPDLAIKTHNHIESKDKSAFPNFPKLPQLTSFKGPIKAFLKVQDGCDGPCTYCIVPKVRPQIHSKPILQILEEAKSLVQTATVLIEDTDPPSGRCERYFIVSLTTKTQSHEEKQNKLVSWYLYGKNEIVKVRITANGPKGAVGEK